jgi:hypothetical protein
VCAASYAQERTGRLLAVARGSSDDSLLTQQHLRRLRRDRDRQTERWLNFKARVESVPDSPQRGFELALYYAVTHDQQPGRNAVSWALTHPCDRDQFPPILDWCADLLSPEERQKLSACPAQVGTSVLSSLQNGALRDPQTLYAASEYLLRLRASHQPDPRSDNPQFFARLPIEFLLSLKPVQIDHPDWRTHIAALALIAVDPNLEGSQYLQSWAIEDRQMLREGPGVAYEFLWADPYLPGVGYENLDPWTYDPAGRLFARSNWNSDSCWIAISTHGIEEENCPAGWRDRPVQFGRMTLVPMIARCVDLPHTANNETLILWRMNPRAAVSYRESKLQHSAQADAAGLLRVSARGEGKACLTR